MDSRINSFQLFVKIRQRNLLVFNTWAKKTTICDAIVITFASPRQDCKYKRKSNRNAQMNHSAIRYSHLSINHFSLVIHSTKCPPNVNIKLTLNSFLLYFPNFRFIFPVTSTPRPNEMACEGKKWINVGRNKAQDNPVPPFFTAGCLPIKGQREKSLYNRVHCLPYLKAVV